MFNIKLMLQKICKELSQRSSVLALTSERARTTLDYRRLLFCFFGKCSKEIYIFVCMNAYQSQRVVEKLARKCIQSILRLFNASVLDSTYICTGLNISEGLEILRRVDRQRFSDG